jgi:hypothetical protein
MWRRSNRGFRCDRLSHRRSTNCRRARLHGGWRNARLCRRSRSHPRGLGSSVLRFFFCFGNRLSVRFLFGGSLNLFAHLLRDVRRDRARVRLLFRHPVPGQQVNDGFGLDLEFAGQLVNSDLIYVGHALRS